MSGRRRGTRDARGAAAVEGALVTAFLLVPLLAGVLYWGDYFWHEQQTSLYPPRLDPSLAVGTCSTSQIAARVTSAAAASIYSLNHDTLAGLGITSATGLTSYLSTTVSSLGSLGADVTVRLRIPGSTSLAGLVPLPGGDLLIRDVTQRLSYVSVSTGSSSCSP